MRILKYYFVIITIMGTLFQTNSINAFFYVLAVAYVFVWFNAFNFAAIDTAKFKVKGRTVYALLTVGLHILLSAIAATAILLLTPFIDAVELAAMLP